MTGIKPLALALMGFIGAGCTGQGTMHRGAVPPGDVIVVRIENHNFNDATIHTSSGKRMRLGMVSGHGEQTFRFRWPHNNLSLVVDFIGGGAFVTEVLSVSEGDEIQLIIESGSHRLSLRRRPVLE